MRIQIFLSILITAFLAIPTYLNAQDRSESISQKLMGHWEGAIIKNHNYQKIEIQFYEDNSEIKSLQIIEDWHPQFGEFVYPATIDSLGSISCRTAKGETEMRLDTNSLEIIGRVTDRFPTVYIHLKKVPTPPTLDYEVSEVKIKSDLVTLNGHLHMPKTISKTAIIIVGGRSCYAGSTKYDLYAKLLREYGVTVLAFNKRGTGASTGDCSMATIDDLADDVAACKKYLEQHPNNYTHIGVLGSSAGGWVMAKAEEKTDFDFMISVVGPSTSVVDQQMQSMDYGLDSYELSDQAKEDLIEYTKLMFEAAPTASSYADFSKLLETSKIDGWFELLDPTDIPTSPEGINDLWVRRHNYDPSMILRDFNKPYLGIYGEDDWIVPHKENIAKLHEAFNGNKRELLDVVLVPEAGHSIETKGKLVTMSNDWSYWRFFRISPSLQIGLIDFLRKHKFIQTAE